MVLSQKVDSKQLTMASKLTKFDEEKKQTKWRLKIVHGNKFDAPVFNVVVLQVTLNLEMK